MSSTEQQSSGPAPADAQVPSEHEIPEELGLAAEFPAVTRDEWRDLVAGVLRKSGREDLPDPVEEALRRTVATGVTVAPLYTAEDAGDLPTAVGVPGLPPFLRGSGAGAAGAAGGPDGDVPGGWDVRQRHAHPDVAVTKEAIAADLENGVTSLWLVIGDGAIPADRIGDVLADVYLDLAPVSVSGVGAGGGVAAAEAFLGLLDARSDTDEPIAPGGSLGLDPLGTQAASGQAQDLSGLAGLARRASAYPGLRTVVVDGTVFADAGGSVVEELGCSLAAGVAYLRALTDGEQGLDVDEAFGQLEFRYSAGADQFTTIAALRAARRLWDRVGEVSGASPGVRGQRQHAVTSSVMTTKRDPWVNMLRTTVACFAAGVGGADSVTVQPFDAALGLPDSFARRIARNTQSLLVEEGHLARVLDPAGGSWYVESLTDELARAAWDWFTEIERAGGLAAALDSGLVRDRIATAWDARAKRLATRSEAVTGVSEFPNLAEKLPERQPAADLHPTGGLPRVRAAQEYEALRDAADAAGERPTVYLATIGPIARHTARASFAGNLFQAGGLATPAGDGAGGLGHAGTTVACICGTDKDYAESAAPLAAALKEAGATQVWLAGKPDLAVDGVDGYVYAGCDALDVLRTVHAQLGLEGVQA